MGNHNGHISDHYEEGIYPLSGIKGCIKGLHNEAFWGDILGT